MTECRLHMLESEVKGEAAGRLEGWKEGLEGWTHFEPPILGRLWLLRGAQPSRTDGGRESLGSPDSNTGIWAWFGCVIGKRAGNCLY